MATPISTATTHRNGNPEKPNQTHYHHRWSNKREGESNLLIATTVVEDLSFEDDQ